MRLYLSADIEGTCGIADWAETERATMDDYRPFAAQMTAEVAAACEGAVAAGPPTTPPATWTRPGCPGRPGCSGGGRAIPCA